MIYDLLFQKKENKIENKIGNKYIKRIDFAARFFKHILLMVVISIVKSKVYEEKILKNKILKT